MSEKKRHYEDYRNGNNNAFPVRVRPKAEGVTYRRSANWRPYEGSYREFIQRVTGLNLYTDGDITTGSCPAHGGGVERVYFGAVSVCLVCYPDRDPRKVG